METAKLTASDRAVGDDFGISVDVDGDTVVVGAGWDGDKGTESGSAYVFTKPGSGGWATTTETAKLTASDGADYDHFGISVAVDGDTVVVGAYGDTPLTTIEHSMPDLANPHTQGYNENTTITPRPSTPYPADAGLHLQLTNTRLPTPREPPNIRHNQLRTRSRSVVQASPACRNTP